ncbi:MAG: PAS domain-containing protein [Deltaproteobacteria bacterium]|nr:PAS domain-containing protein [Deltaproteobacteria bacterium]
MHDEIPNGQGSEAKIAHLSALLRAIHKVSLLLAREKDLSALLQGTCDILVDSRGYRTAWIALLDGQREPTGLAGAGFGDGLVAVRQRLEAGSFPWCWERALAQPDAIGVRDPSSECGDCPLVQVHCDAGAMVCRLAHGGDTLGLMAVSVPGYLLGDPDEQAFFEELARDVVLAVRKLAAEEELRRSESRLAEAQRIAHLGNWDWDIARDQLYWSDEIYRIFGLTPRQFGATYEAFLRSVHPDDRQAVESAVERALRDRAPYFVTHRILLPDGSIRTVHERAEVTFDSAGKAVRMLGTVQDLTELARAQGEREQLITAVEAAGEAIVVTDGRGMVQYVNPAFESVTGFSPEDVQGQLLPVMDREQHPELAADLDAALARAGLWRGRLVRHKKDGTPYQEACTVSSVKDASGEVTNYVAVKRDVSEQLRLESMAEAVNIADNIGYVFSGIRHEIGNPVNAIRMTLSMLRSRLDKEGDEQAADYIRRCLEELARIQYLLDSLKNFSMFENPDVREMDLGAFFAKLESLLVRDLDAQGIGLRIELADGAATCLADPRALQQVMLNIATNAMEACRDRPEPEIAIRIAARGGAIRIQVADNGRGMTAEQQKKLFRPFHTSKPDGTGLGLVIARRLLLRMNGRIEIASRPGEGTEVRIDLPGA